MSEHVYQERKNAFSPIQEFLLSSKIVIKGVSEENLFRSIGDTFSPKLAKRVVDLWVGMDPSNKNSIYYTQNQPYLVECEDVYELLAEGKEIYLNTYDLPYRYVKKTEFKNYIAKIMKYNFRLLIGVIIIGIIILLFKGGNWLPGDDRQNTSSYSQVSQNVKSTTHIKNAQEEKVDKPKEVYSRTQKKEVYGEKKTQQTISFVPIVPSCTYYIATAKLKVRQGPAQYEDEKGIILKSEKVCITKKNNSWYYVKDRGWVYKKYLDKVDILEEQNNKAKNMKTEPKHKFKDLFKPL